MVIASGWKSICVVAASFQYVNTRFGELPAVIAGLVRSTTPSHELAASLITTLPTVLTFITIRLLSAVGWDEQLALVVMITVTISASFRVVVVYTFEFVPTF